MSDPKPHISSKTLQFNGVLLAISTFLATLPQFAATPPFDSILAALPENVRVWVSAVLGLVSAVNIILRLVTKQPVGKAGAK
jgi:hypothetical protein